MKREKPSDQVKKLLKKHKEAGTERATVKKGECGAKYYAHLGVTTRKDNLLRIRIGVRNRTIGYPIIVDIPKPDAVAFARKIIDSAKRA